MSHIFISHQTTDVHLADLVKEKLKSAGFMPWVDHDDIRASQVWSQEIEDALSDSLAIIVIITPDMIKSDFITYEWSYSLGAKKPVIGVMMKNTDTNDIHPQLRRLQHLNYVNRSLSDDNKLIDTLTTLIANPDAQIISTPKDSSSKPNLPTQHSRLYVKLKLKYDLKKPVTKPDYLSILAKLGYISKEEWVYLLGMDRDNPSA